MSQVWKFVLGPAETKIEMPKDAEILTVATQGNMCLNVCLWAKVNPDAEKEERVFMTYGTGHNIPDDINLDYVGTVQFSNLVFHIFEKI